MATELTRQAWAGRVSDWKDPLDAPMAELGGHYGMRVARSDVEPVDALRAAVGITRPKLTVVVVGSNGKTSTATYLSDIFRAAGCRTGLYTSPHIAYWTERVRIDDAPVDGRQLVEAVRDVDALAQSEELHDDRFRFFDVLTLAGAKLFGESGADVAVYEAGIGGRADPTRCLRPELVVLTAVGLEHTQLLGEREEEILLHKLDVAPEDAIVVAGMLPERLAALARDHAHGIGVTLIDADIDEGRRPSGVPWYLGQNWQLARGAAAAGLERLRVEPPDLEGPRPVYGRFSTVVRAGVEYVLDVAHNPQAWDAFVNELRRRLPAQSVVGVVAVTRERSVDPLVEAIVASRVFSKIYVTNTSVRPTHDPSLLTAALGEAGQAAESVGVPAEAFGRASASARAGGGRVAVFGSTFLVTDAMSWLGEAPPQFARPATSGR